MLLKEFLDVNSIKYSGFAEQMKINRITLQYILKRARDIKLSTAIRIVEATGGAVSYKELLPEEKREAKAPRNNQSSDSSKRKPDKKKNK
jgi:plasmid maintenance system antidote protein VapI